MFNKSITRLIQYRLCLIHYKDLGIQRIFSYTIARETGVSPEQVRKDFSIFRIRGNKKAGYDINQLIDQINEILSKSKVKNIIIIGAGNLGKALMNYNGFQNRNLHVVAVFDIDPAKQGRQGKTPVLPIRDLSRIIKKEEVSIAIIAVPEKTAQQVCDLLVENGIRGILNFAPTILKGHDQVMIRNICMCSELEALIYFTEQIETL